MAAMMYQPTFDPIESLSDEQLQQAIADRLNKQLNNMAVATQTAQFFMDSLLNWHAESVPVTQVESILAFAFGNRISLNGNQHPGPMNEAIADSVVLLYRQNAVPVYAQWEVAEAIGSRIPVHDLNAIYPRLSGKGNTKYLCTQGVAEKAVLMAGSVSNLGKTAVVAFFEHSLRTVDTAREAGIDAFLPQGLEMPRQFDPDSGQAWTRDQQTYVMHEIRTRATNERDRLIQNAVDDNSK
ncbi:hypothetical protein ACQKPX_01515 [Photobacterium sp. DNB23_23_1]|uniref:Uncharacterized protein n=1 Tax=Photobacterium pectinilyticum TaxID=2906793 RepID=A0ABT1MZX8_9GAMM|nr:hypothetical protein [Photobacterium sp. ZSDE20]MCQ1058036.1 hypothetical protein [Photobacterium sp. ZSDE20]MDD1822569.1 hypothetical protein [Photobacterium sp. ZSDE20]